MFSKVNSSIYESEDGYVVEFKKEDGEKAAFVGKKREDGKVRLLFIVSAEGMSRRDFLKHLEENFNLYLEKYVK